MILIASSRFSNKTCQADSSEKHTKMCSLYVWPGQKVVSKSKATDDGALEFCMLEL